MVHFEEGPDLFTTYRAGLRFRDKLMGGTPGDPKLVEAWLRKNLHNDTTQEEIKRLRCMTLAEMRGEDADYITNLSAEELDAETDRLLSLMATKRNATVFKRDEDGPYLESRHIKAMFKECTNILFAGTRVGKTGKGAKNYLAERVFVNPPRIHFGLDAPHGVELFVGHVTGPQGPRSTLTYYEYVERMTIEFDVIVLAGAAERELAPLWRSIWGLACENGLGALRSQDHGKFDLVKWHRAEDEGKQSAPKRARRVA